MSSKINLLNKNFLTLFLLNVFTAVATNQLGEIPEIDHKDVAIESPEISQQPLAKRRKIDHKDVPKQHKILDWLHNMAPSYALGITEYGASASGLTLFQELGIPRWLATSAATPLPAFYHFLGMSMPLDVPGKYKSLNLVLNSIIRLYPRN